MRFDFKCYRTPPTILLWLPLCPWVSFSGGFQHPPIDGCSATSCSFGVLEGKDECTSFYSTTRKWLLDGLSQGGCQEIRGREGRRGIYSPWSLPAGWLQAPLNSLLSIVLHSAYPAICSMCPSGQLAAPEHDLWGLSMTYAHPYPVVRVSLNPPTLPVFAYTWLIHLLSQSAMYALIGLNQAFHSVSTFIHSADIFQIPIICECSKHACSVSPVLCNPMDWSPNALLPMGFFLQAPGVGCHFLFQGIFPTQGSNPCLLHWQADSLPLSQLGSPLCVWGTSYEPLF